MLFFRELQKEAEQTSKDKRVFDYFCLSFSVKHKNTGNTCTVNCGPAAELGHARSVNIPTWLRGFRIKIFEVSFVSQYPKETWIPSQQHTQKFVLKASCHVGISIYRPLAIVYLDIIKDAETCSFWLNDFRAGQFPRPWFSRMRINLLGPTFTLTCGNNVTVLSEV